MRVTAEEIDKQVEFLRKEEARLRKIGARWADNNANQFRDIRETLLEYRRTLQMTTVGGTRLE